jgi:hypothetical protein
MHNLEKGKILKMGDLMGWKEDLCLAQDIGSVRLDKNMPSIMANRILIITVYDNWREMYPQNNQNIHHNKQSSLTEHFDLECSGASPQIAMSILPNHRADSDLPLLYLGQKKALRIPQRQASVPTVGQAPTHQGPQHFLFLLPWSFPVSPLC